MSRARSLRIFLTLTLLGGLIVSLRPAAVDAQGGADVRGDWRFVGGAPERRGISDAIDASLDALNPVMREIVAAQLRNTNRAYPSFSIATEGTDIVTRVNGRSLRTPADGSAREVTTAEGRTAQATQRITGAQMLQVLRNPRGTRTHRFSAQGDRMVVQVRIESSHLPRAVEYRLTYARQ